MCLLFNDNNIIINYMGKLAILNSVSFESKQKFEDLKKIKDTIKTKVSFEQFTNTLDMYHIVQRTFEKYADILITNCFYNDKYLIQSFSVDNSEYVVFVKRSIHDNDTYTFFEFEPEKIETDIYKYEDITLDDVCDIYRKKTVFSCVKVCSNGEIINDEIILLNSNEDVGKILLSNNKELLSLNMTNIINKYHSEKEINMEEIIREKTNAYCANHLFTQIDLGFVILNCYYPTFSKEKNVKISELLNCDIYGDVIIFLQNKDEHDNEFIIWIDDTIFKKIHNVVTKNIKIERNNKHFFNLYKELRSVFLC